MMMIRNSMKLLLVFMLLLPCVAGFVVLPKQHQNDGRVLMPHYSTTSFPLIVPSKQQQQQVQYRLITTRRYALLDVPDNFFTILLPTLSLCLAFSKAVARSRLEERAWEQRLEEARRIALEKDPTLTDVDLRKREAAAEWSAYGNNNNNNNNDEDSFTARRQRARQQQQQQQVLTRDMEDAEDAEQVRREFSMTQEEIQAFEQEFGVEFDPYYDDPYTEDELPEDVPYKVDKLYGDRIYKDGEVFYKDDKTGLYYRQGSQPRIQKFW